MLLLVNLVEIWGLNSDKEYIDYGNGSSVTISAADEIKKKWKMNNKKFMILSEGGINYSTFDVDGSFSCRFNKVFNFYSEFQSGSFYFETNDTLSVESTSNIYAKFKLNQKIIEPSKTKEVYYISIKGYSSNKDGKDKNSVPEHFLITEYYENIADISLEFDEKVGDYIVNDVEYTLYQYDVIYNN